ncbi:MAG: hypothetical protein LBQ15_05940 [Clostridium sp.]|jgi:hypothetical protein|nr:hypothetical protein [Clostridium sp.]
MKHNMLKKVTATILGIGIVSMGAAALAGTSYEPYDTTVAAFNGNGYTGYQKKATTGANGALSSTSVGGTYVVDARMQDATSGVHGPWVRDVNDSTSYVLYSDAQHSATDSMRVQFSNDLTTPVSVQVTGNWKSN